MKFTLLLAFILNVLSSLAQTERAEVVALYQKSLLKSIPFQQSLNYGRQALQQSEQLHLDSLTSLIHIHLGILYWNDGQFSLAMRHLDRGQELSEQSNNDFQVTRCLHYKGLVTYYRCSFDSALAYYNAAERKYSALGQDSAVAKIKSHKGLIYNLQGDYPRAIENMVLSFRLQENTPGYRDLSLPMQFPNEATEKLYYQSKLEKDLESLKFLLRQNNNTKVAFALFNVGKDYYYLKEYEKAIPYFRKSAQRYQQLGELPFTGDLAAAYVGTGRYDSAEYWYKIRMQEVKARGTQIHLSALYGELGMLYKLQHRWGEALNYYDLALSLNSKIGLKRSTARIEKERALVQIEMGKLTEALQAIEHSLMIARQIQSLKDIQELLEVKADLLQKLNRVGEALITLRQSNLLRDSITNGESQLQSVRLQIEYDSEKKSRDLLALQTQHELNEAALANKNLLLLLGVFMMVLVVVLGIFLFWRFKQEEKSARELALRNKLVEEKNELLEEQTRQKEALLHEIHHRVKNNLQIISSLINLKARQASADTRESLQQIGTRIFSMGLVHEKLYQKDDIQLVRVDSYLKEVGAHLIQTFGDADHPVGLCVDAEAIEMKVDRALTCGLIFNELITNSMKYAFADEQKEREIRMALRKTETAVTWEVSDNGRKTKEWLEGVSKSFGLRFVDQLITSKLGGTWQIEINQGFHAHITVPLHQNGKDTSRHH